MTRPRLASAVLAAGLGLVCGCSSDFSFRNPFSHHRPEPAACESGCCPVDCPSCPCGMGGCPSCGGAVSGFDGPILTPPEIPAVPVVPQPVVPPPHLVPAPAVPMPYTP